MLNTSEYEYCPQFVCNMFYLLKSADWENIQRKYQYKETKTVNLEVKSCMELVRTFL